MVTDEGKRRIQISLPPELRAELETTCRRLGITKSSAIALSLRDWLVKVAKAEKQKAGII